MRAGLDMRENLIATEAQGRKGQMLEIGQGQGWNGQVLEDILGTMTRRTIHVPRTARPGAELGPDQKPTAHCLLHGSSPKQ